MKWLRALWSKLFGGGSKIPSYEIVDRTEDELSAFKITSGKYKGIVYLVGNVGFTEDSNGGVVLSFKTQILENPKKIKLDKTNFTNVSGDILSEFMKKQADDVKNWLYLKG